MAIFSSAGIIAAAASAGIGVSPFLATPSVYVIKKKPKVKK